MDVELSEAVDGSTASILSDAISSNFIFLEKPTPWQAFIASVRKHKGFCLFIFLFLLCLCVGTSVYLATKRDDNYLLCCKEWINIHLIPHSHDDVGWLRTPEHYFEYTVKYILDNVIYELEKNPERKFVYVETYFFWQWWLRQSPGTQASVKRLVDNGQFVFAGGGWTMNDEATTNYMSVIDQYTWGFRRLNDTFGEAARIEVGWQIDTFGHSRETASLLTQMGLNGLFFARIDEEERSQRRDRQTMEFYWDDRGGATKILTSVMYKHYNPPTGFHYEKENNEGANLDVFVSLVREQASAYKTRNVLVPMGDDFTYYDAQAWFDNMDALIREVNRRKRLGLNINMFYSTPSAYLKSIKGAGVELPVKKGDFFPYGSDLFSYWTGYYTSRPTLKFFERTMSNYLQVLKQLGALSHEIADDDQALISLRESLYILTHHDGITGTAKQHVTDHYVDLIYRSFLLTWTAIGRALNTLVGNNGSSLPLVFEHCLLLNVSECAVSEFSQNFVVTAYNSLSWNVARTIRLPVLGAHYTVRNGNGVFLPVQIVPLPPEVRLIPGRNSSAIHELVFNTGEIPPFGFSSFYITTSPVQIITNDLFTYPSSNIRLNFHRFTGLLSGMSRNAQDFPIGQDLEFYQGSAFWTGAYIFRPASNYPDSMEGPVETQFVTQGPVFDEYQQTLGPWSSQILRIYRDAPYLEIEWLVGPIPVEDYLGKEVISIYTSTIASDGVFYTDTNSRGSLPRRRNRRDDWRYTSNEAISGNYYPINSYISVRDNSSHMYVITDRPQGGASIRDGQLELMIHRRLCYDDGKGVNEPLNETAFDEGLVVRGRHWLLMGPPSIDLEQKAKRLAMELQNEPFLFLSSTDLNFEQWRSSGLTSFNGLSGLVSPSLRILTLEPWRDGLILLRLEHMFEKIPNTPLSQPFSVKLRTLFSTFVVTAVRETALGADRWLHPQDGWIMDDIDIKLEPTAIRTFLLQVLPNIP